MKTAVSLPDPLFDAAESARRRWGLGRSELYSRALEDYLERHRDDEVREALEAVYGATRGEVAEGVEGVPSSWPKEDGEKVGLDPVLQALQRASIEEDEGW